MRLAVIGGSGLYSLSALQDTSPLEVDTPYGVVHLQQGWLGGRELLFLPRHGPTHRLPPHAINYRANIWALHALQVGVVWAVNAVGGIDSRFSPGVLAVPDQLIDYTWGRPSTFADTFTDAPVHLEFADPFAGVARELLVRAVERVAPRHMDGGTYGVTQGPRLETRAEIHRLARDGCHIVGMTALPEAALARELGMDYAALCAVVNWAAGVADSAVITLADVFARLDEMRPTLEATLTAAVSAWPR